ncbi:DUF4468 domain-containing protein [Elizabethkingia anophelis]|nr:DUF4468 domain-containing protein [Elizabethkingia anophelis]MCT4148190.1 DUF4468 domain-containing protein [Elizabethkingia anophelis]
MKKLFTILSTIAYISLFSQGTQFLINDDGLSKYVVTEVNNYKKEDLYNKTIEWINRYYKNPKEVIKGTIINDYIRIEGYSDNAFRRPAIGGVVNNPLKYQIEVSFKDGKYKFEVISMEIKNYMFPQFSNNPFMAFNLSKDNEYVRKKNGEYRNTFKYITDIPIFFDKINMDLKTYIESGTTNNKTNNDW